MAKKSKTQKAKASARRAEKRDATEELVSEETSLEASQDAEGAQLSAKKASVKEAKVKVAEKPAAPKKKEPGRIARFFNGVRSEMRRVTWPTRTDVIRWSGVVVGALLFFGVFVFVLDNIFPQLLIALDSLGA